MKNKNMNKNKSLAQNGTNKGKGKKRFSVENDPFFDAGSKRRKNLEDDENIESSDEDSEEFDDEFYGGEGKEVAVAEFEEETAAEKKKRIADDYVAKVRESTKRLEKEKDEEGESDDDDAEKEGERDTLVGHLLLQEQLEVSGRVQRSIASRVQKPTDGFRIVVKHRQSVTAVALSEDDSKGFSASKDGTIVHWDIGSGKSEKYIWPNEELLKSHGLKDPQGRATKQSKHVSALSVSSDGRYLATGGFDRHVHLWDIRTRQHIQAFPGHKGPVSCLTFRQGTTELFSGSSDRSIKIWNANDRSYITTLFGHTSEIFTIDSLRKERVLTVGRDRTMHLWKVPEESHVVFRAPKSSLECCCFISNDEYLSGSDDGSIVHWSVTRKKPIHIVKNAHPMLRSPNKLEQLENGGLLNGHLDGLENLCSSVNSWVGSVCVCRSSDLAASGAGNGSVRLWLIEKDSKGITPLFELPLAGFVNSLAFSKSGEFLIAGVGQEPRLGRWGRIPEVKNGVYLHSLKLS